MIATTATDRVLVDSSGWLEALTDDVNAEKFHPYLLREPDIVVPAIVIYEVFKILTRQRPQPLAAMFISHALRCQVVPLDENIAMGAALASIEHKLSMADAIIYTTALNHQVELITGDAAFQGLPGVTLIQ